MKFLINITALGLLVVSMGFLSSNVDAGYSSPFWLNDSICYYAWSFLYKSTNGYHCLNKEQMYDFITTNKGMWHGFSLDDENEGEQTKIFLDIDRLTFTNLSLCPQRLKRIGVYSKTRGKGLPFKCEDPDLLVGNVSYDSNRVYCTLYGETYDDIFSPAFHEIDALVWLDSVHFPVVVKLAINRKTFDLETYTIAQYFRRGRRKERNYRTHTVLPETFNNTNYVIVFNGGKKELEIIGMHDDGSVFEEKPFPGQRHISDMPLGMKVNQIEANTHWISTSTNIFETNQIKVSGFTFINANAYLPAGFVLDGISCFDNKNAVITCRNNGKMALVMLQYNKRTVKTKRWSGGAITNKYNLMICIEQPNGDIDIVVKSEKKIWPLVYTIKQGEWADSVGSLQLTLKQTNTVAETQSERSRRMGDGPE